MIWRQTAPRHLASIGGFARYWLGGTLFDRLIPVTLIGWFWVALWLFIGMASRSVGGVLFCLMIGTLPWVLLALDAIIDAQTVQGDIANFARDGAILATRCEYTGGHPELPHGRFAYLLLEGTRQNPNVTLVFPHLVGSPTERYRLPILDFNKTDPDRGSDASPAADIAAMVNPTAGRFLRPERLTLVVDYNGPGGRTYRVVLGNFFRGNNEIHNWRNYLVCAQAQSDGGAQPHEPWLSLPDEPEDPENAPPPPTSKETLPHAFSRNGPEVEQRSSAFARR